MKKKLTFDPDLYVIKKLRWKEAETSSSCSLKLSSCCIRASGCILVDFSSLSVAVDGGISSQMFPLLQPWFLLFFLNRRSKYCADHTQFDFKLRSLFWTVWWFCCAPTCGPGSPAPIPVIISNLLISRDDDNPATCLPDYCRRGFTRLFWAPGFLQRRHQQRLLRWFRRFYSDPLQISEIKRFQDGQVLPATFRCILNISSWSDNCLIKGWKN